MELLVIIAVSSFLLAATLPFIRETLNEYQTQLSLKQFIINASIDVENEFARLQSLYGCKKPPYGDLILSKVKVKDFQNIVSIRSIGYKTHNEILTGYSITLRVNTTELYNKFYFNEKEYLIKKDKNNTIHIFKSINAISTEQEFLNFDHKTTCIKQIFP